jgi:hypothetical protein
MSERAISKIFNLKVRLYRFHDFVEFLEIAVIRAELARVPHHNVLEDPAPAEKRSRRRAITSSSHPRPPARRGHGHRNEQGNRPHDGDSLRRSPVFGDMASAR